MASIIQIKRSTTTAVPTDGSLAAGELAFSGLPASNSLFVGDTNGNPIRVAGTKYLWLHQANTTQPGSLTANAVILTNGNSFITNLKSNALTIGTDGATLSVTNISSFANSTQIGGSAGGSNAELLTSYAVKTYVDLNAPLLTNTHVAFGSNNFSNGGSASFTFDSTTSVLTVGNSTVNTTISGAAIATDGTLEVTGAANLASTLGIVGAATLSNTIAVTGAANLASTLGVTGAATLSNTIAVTGNATFSNTIAVTGNATFSNTIAVTGAANLASTLGVAGAVAVTGAANLASTLGVVGAVALSNTIDVTGNATFSNTMAVTGAANLASTLGVVGAVTLSNTIAVTGNATFSNTIAVTGNATFSNNLTVTGSVTNVANFNASGDVTVGGNLAINGTLTTINTTTLNISDPLIRLANNNNTTDVVDVGFFGSFGNNTVIQYTGLFRDQSDSAVYKLFSGAIPEPGSTVNTANANFAFADLQVKVLFAATVNTANAQITGGAITGITDLAVADGGTGVSVFANNGIIFGSNTASLSVTAAGTEGQLLTAGAGGVPAFATLDGGSF